MKETPMHHRHGPFDNFNFSLSLLTERLGYSSSKWRRCGKKSICVSRIYRSCFKNADFSAQVAYLHCTTKLTLYIQYLFDLKIPRHSVSVQSTYLPNILHNPFHVISGAQSITS